MKLKDILQKAKGGIEKIENIKDELNSIDFKSNRRSKIDEVDTQENELRDDFEQNQKKANNQWIMIGVAVVVVVLVLFRKKLKF